MDDLFGDASLFAEFEKDREADNSFIRYDENADRSKIIFEGFDESEDEESDIEWSQENDYISSTTNTNGGEVKKSEVKVEVEDDEVAKTKTSPNEDHDNTEKDANKHNNESVEGMEDESNVKEEENEDEKTDQSSQSGIEKPKEKEPTTSSENPENNPIPIDLAKDNELKKSFNDNKSSMKDKSSVKATKKENNGSDINKMLDDDDTAWLYEHLYNHEKITRDAKQNMKQLIHERNKYHRYSKILDSTRYVPDEDSPAVQLIFNNTAFSRKYRQQIEQFIKGLLWQEFNSSNPETMTEIDIKPGAPSCVEINEQLRSDQRIEKMRRNHAILGSGQFHKQFLIDFLGWPFTVSEPPRCNINWEIPLYGQVFDEVYADPSSKPIKPATKKQKPSCWNCGHENHSVAECRLPRNQARISQNRKEFMELHQQNKTQPKFTGASRYHLDPEIASKFNKFRPGVISDELREAMGLKSDQLPQHIYKMRLFGYPPGWLHEAKQVESGVSIYDKEGRVTLCSGAHLEDGEIKDAGSSEYDVNRIVEFPGFTIPTPLGIIDEHATYKMPPIQQHQLKKTLVSQSEEKAAAKKRKRDKQAEEQQKEETETKKARIEITEDEVDAEKTESSEKLDDKKESENKDEGMDDKENDDKGNDEKENGEKEKDEKQKDEIEKNEIEMDEKEKDEMVKEEKEMDVDATNEETPQTPTAETPPTGLETPKVQKDSRSSTISLSKDFGTPILVRHKNALPDASKFAVGAEDHIPFENLPEATGTFEKMKNIIDIIRKKNKS